VVISFHLLACLVLKLVFNGNCLLLNWYFWNAVNTKCCMGISGRSFQICDNITSVGIIIGSVADVLSRIVAFPMSLIRNPAMGLDKESLLGCG
jgi:hypothetical protein